MLAPPQLTIILCWRGKMCIFVHTCAHDLKVCHPKQEGGRAPKMVSDPASHLPLHRYPLAKVQKMDKIAHVTMCSVRPIPRALHPHVLHVCWGTLARAPCTSTCSYQAASRHLCCPVVCAKNTKKTPICASAAPLLQFELGVRECARGCG